MSYQAYNGQVYGLYIESKDVFEVYDELLDLGAVFIDESFEDVTIESAINDSTFNNKDKKINMVSFCLKIMTIVTTLFAPHT